MTQKTIEKLDQKISSLKEEMNILRSFVIGALGKDREGDYRPEFVEKILKTSKKRGNFSFKNANAFLEKLRKIS